MSNYSEDRKQKYRDYLKELAEKANSSRKLEDQYLFMRKNAEFGLSEFHESKLKYDLSIWFTIPLMVLDLYWTNFIFSQTFFGVCIIIIILWIYLVIIISKNLEAERYRTAISITMSMEVLGKHVDELVESKHKDQNI